jgi:hypothetical protein
MHRMPNIAYRKLSLDTVHRCAPAKVQRGSALIVSMVFLIILTILGVSTMNTSRIEIRMATNVQAANQAFQASESGIEATLDEVDIFNTGAGAGVDHTYFFNQNTNGGFNDGSNDFLERVTTNTLFEVQGSVPAGGFSLGSTVSAFHFRILSTGESAAGSESQQIQGFYKIGPG